MFHISPAEFSKRLGMKGPECAHISGVLDCLVQEIKTSAQKDSNTRVEGLDTCATKSVMLCKAPWYRLWGSSPSQVARMTCHRATQRAQYLPSCRRPAQFVAPTPTTTSQPHAALGRCVWVNFSYARTSQRWQMWAATVSMRYAFQAL